MRWLFLLLLILNVFYYVWHQQQAPMQAKEIAPLSLHRAGSQDIHLLSEAKSDEGGAERCLYLGGVSSAQQLDSLRQRLGAENIAVAEAHLAAEQGGGYWLRVGVPGQPLPDESTWRDLSHDVKEVKHQIMQCEGIATGE